MEDDLTDEERRKRIAEFIFHFGQVLGSLWNEEIADYLRERGVTNNMILTTSEAMAKIVPAFYKDV